jgi:hypothetical protein
VKPETETTKWRELSYHFMTEESGGEDEDTITRHELPWRSELAAKFVRKLDYRYTKEQKAKRLKCKARTDGAVSQLSPMEGTAWAI